MTGASSDSGAEFSVGIGRAASLASATAVPELDDIGSVMVESVDGTSAENDSLALISELKGSEFVDTSSVSITFESAVDPVTKWL